jgi:DNA modification methylase
MCGDSTDVNDVERLMDDEQAVLLHADPPYGMGKEKDGVENDNLYREKLDAFQMAWWSEFRPCLMDNASAYIWGNAPDLWRLWYVGGLKDSERLTMRNEIVWSKGHGQGMESDQHRMYATVSERCLFFMLGEQGFNNNADNYWEGWEPIRKYLKDELSKVGDIKWAKRAAGHSEKSGCHWFDSSQWMMPTEEVYKAWQAAARESDAFKREYDDLKREYDDLKREYDDLKREFYATRAYFDNTHDNMTDVWDFKRVTGEERHGHATPKPVQMIERIVKSSSRPGDVVADPFSGSGTTIIACEQLGRKCRAMEISPAYVDVAVKRWEAFTGKKAQRIEDLP